jgi:hypothetical protein
MLVYNAACRIDFYNLTTPALVAGACNNLRRVKNLLYHLHGHVPDHHAQQPQVPRLPGNAFLALC